MVRTKVVVRTRPTDAFATENVVFGPDNTSVTLRIPRRSEKASINADHLEPCAFAFDSVLHNATQEQVFASLGDVVSGVLQGVNGSIMAYGQTGAGKTYTMLGGADFRTRGIVPRAISALYAGILDRADASCTVEATFVELYNDVLYDLLLPAGAPATELSIQEDGRGSVSVRGATVRECANESDALSAMFDGVSARHVAEHAYNRASSRGHAVFTLSVSVRSRVTSDGRALRGKLLCADLAGSERLKKTEASGVLAREAVFVNRSLALLEQVVSALMPPIKDHVPFRQSKLTVLLKDGLGGNARSALVCCVWPESTHLDETVAALRFAQRMSRLVTQPQVNATVDPVAQVRALQRQVAELRAELQVQNQLHGRSQIAYLDDISPAERQILEAELSAFLTGTAPELPIRSVRQTREIFRMFRALYLDLQGRTAAAAPPGSAPAGGVGVTVVTSVPAPSVSPNAPGSGVVRRVSDGLQRAGGGVGELADSGVSVGRAAAPAKSLSALRTLSPNPAVSSAAAQGMAAPVPIPAVPPQDRTPAAALNTLAGSLPRPAADSSPAGGALVPAGGTEGLRLPAVVSPGALVMQSLGGAVGGHGSALPKSEAYEVFKRGAGLALTMQAHETQVHARAARESLAARAAEEKSARQRFEAASSSLEATRVRRAIAGTSGNVGGMDSGAAAADDLADRAEAAHAAEAEEARAALLRAGHLHAAAQAACDSSHKVAAAARRRLISEFDAWYAATGGTTAGGTVNSAAAAQTQDVTRSPASRGGGMEDPADTLDEAERFDTLYVQRLAEVQPDAVPFFSALRASGARGGPRSRASKWK